MVYISRMPQRDYKMDLCHGSLFRLMLRYTLPIIGSLILQRLLGASDLFVIGRYASSESLAAVGSTLTIIWLIGDFFIGLTVGINVVAANYFGAKDNKGLQATIQTAMLFTLLFGIAITFIALLAAKPLLILMQTPANILPKSCTYLWIYLASLPFTMFYNTGSAVLLAIGDTRRPSLFILIAGVLNVLLNLLFVIVFKMDVAGVALATLICNSLSAILIIRVLCRTKDIYHLEIHQLHSNWKVLWLILRIGLPAALQSSAFSVSNILMQSSINSFGKYAIAGGAASVVFESIVFCCTSACHGAVISFTAQNFGGRHYKRILKSFYVGAAMAFIFTSAFGNIFFLFGEPLMGILTQDKEVIAWGMIRMKVIFTTYGLIGIMDCAAGCLRGMGFSLIATTNALLSIFVLRIVWIFAIFPHWRSMEGLLMSYPVSWSLGVLANSIFLYWAFKKMLQRLGTPNLEWSFWKTGLPRGYRLISYSK